MGTMYWLRVTMMVAIFIVVLWSMRQLNKGHHSSAPATFSLCPTRITWIESNGTHLEELNTKWMLSQNKGPMHEVDGLAAEQWFSRLCSASLTKTKATADFKPLIKIGYITGPDRIVQASGEDYKLEEFTFTSPELANSLRTLPTLPEPSAPGHP
jgi:hypothetical protein